MHMQCCCCYCSLRTAPLNNCVCVFVFVSAFPTLRRAMNKFTRRRRSTDYRTDLPIFRPSIADMVADARNRLLKFKEAQMQSHGRILTPATLAAMLLTDRQLKGAGQCVVSGTSVDPAIDAYTQFLHRYALHVSGWWRMNFPRRF